MKYLTLLRHAKSSWKGPQLADFDRPLNKRGRTDAPFMGERLAFRGLNPDRIIASPALRARLTAEVVALALQRGEESIHWEASISEADLTTLLTLIRKLPDSWQDILLVGHNPGLTELANCLAPCNIANIVTCGAVRIALPADTWTAAGRQAGRLEFYDTPGEVPGGSRS